MLPTEKGGRDKLKNDFYRVATGTTEDDAKGWIPKDDVVEWPHRQALGFRPAGRSRETRSILPITARISRGHFKSQTGKAPSP